MNLVSIKTTPVKKKPKKSQNAKLMDLFESLWQRVQKNIKRNATFQKRLDKLKARYEKEVLPCEQAFNDQSYTETRKLMEFFKRKSLNQWQRCTLAKWISENIEVLLSHPRYDHQAKTQIADDFRALLQQHLPEDPDEFEDDCAAPEMQDFSQEDLFTEPEDFNQNNKQENEDESRDKNREESEYDSNFENFFKQHFSQQEWNTFQAEKATLEKQDNEAKRLLKSSSIRSMFRRVAKVLHPDLEADETKKAEKHHLMSQLIAAREEQDIVTIFQMHREFVSDTPIEVEDHELGNIVQLLQRQINKLDAERQEMAYQDHVTAAIVELFNGRSEKIVSAQINAHINEIKHSQVQSQEFVKNVSSLKKLKPYLEERYYGGLMPDDEELLSAFFYE